MIRGGPDKDLEPVHGLEITDLLDRCPSVVKFRKRGEEMSWTHNALGGVKAHPDADIIRVSFNCEHAVYYNGSKIYMLDHGLNTAWGPTPMRAAKNALKMLDYQNIYTQCSCRWTQWDLDFEPVPGTIQQRCRLCGKERDIQ